MTERFPRGWWTRERIVNAIQAYAARYGAPPTYDDWDMTRARERRDFEAYDRMLFDGCWPNSYTVVRVFDGSWRAALEAAGFESRKIGRPAGGPLPERCVRGHLWSETARHKTRPASATRAAYSVRVCRECEREDHHAYYMRTQRLGKP